MHPRRRSRAEFGLVCMSPVSKMESILFLVSVLILTGGTELCLSARHFVGPDMGPTCLQRSSADNTRRQTVNALYKICPRLLANFLNKVEATTRTK